MEETTSLKRVRVAKLRCNRANRDQTIKNHQVRIRGLLTRMGYEADATDTAVKQLLAGQTTLEALENEAIEAACATYE